MPHDLLYLPGGSGETSILGSALSSYVLSKEGIHSAGRLVAAW